MNKHVLYVGLNDKDSRTQKITVPEAFTVASNICANLAGGGTIHTGRGRYLYGAGLQLLQVLPASGPASGPLDQLPRVLPVLPPDDDAPVTRRNGLQTVAGNRYF